MRETSLRERSCGKTGTSFKKMMNIYNRSLWRLCFTNVNGICVIRSEAYAVDIALRIVTCMLHIMIFSLFLVTAKA